MSKIIKYEETIADLIEKLILEVIRAYESEDYVTKRFSYKLENIKTEINNKLKLIEKDEKR